MLSGTLEEWQLILNYDQGMGCLPLDFVQYHEQLHYEQVKPCKAI